MSKHNWEEITKEDVIKAIHLFEKDDREYPMPRSTFLLYNGKKYPAKHIRGIAYKVHFNTEISKSEYTGGMETVRFFERLGFDTQHISKSKDNTKKIDLTRNESSKPFHPHKINLSIEEKNRIKIPYKEVIEQKNALQLVLNKIFDGDIVCEKTFDWMKTPNEYNDDYINLISELSKYRGNDSFAKKNVKLRCDFVCESRKLIIEYDERQHFSMARRISLLAYPDISLCYDKNLWVQACTDIQAKDNQPRDRDEVRAYYDSVRDIEASRNGYKLVRIMHGQTDFNSPNASRILENMLSTVLNLPEESKGRANNKIPSIKVGLYLQTREYRNKRSFDKAVSLVRESDIDILVFPEISYFPFEKAFNKADFAKQKDVDSIYEQTQNFSKQISRAVIVNSVDRFGRIVSVYANANASAGETKFKHYIKHTMTECSAFEADDYKDCYRELFSPIIYKDSRIGMTICYDCNHSLFSRMYGLYNVDIIINSTGGNVVYDKWYKYNKARSIENNCYSFVTMGGYGAGNNPNCYVYGFSPNGKALTPTILGNTSVIRNNMSGCVYVFDTSTDDGKTEPDPSCSQTSTVNKNSDFYLDIKNIDSLLKSCSQIDNNLFIKRTEENNIVFAIIDGMEIMKPEIVLKLLYSERIKELKNKKYILINKWEYVDNDFYDSKLSVVLKVRATENFCAVILSSQNIIQCIQSGKNRTAQVVENENGKYGLDLSRTGGPEVIWKNKRGMKKSWRKGFEFLIGNI